MTSLMNVSGNMKGLLFLLAAISTSYFVSFGQCDVNLKPSDNPTLAYKLRGKKCEGAYAAKVGAPSLDLIGFTIGKLSYKLERTEVIQIENIILIHYLHPRLAKSPRVIGALS